MNILNRYKSINEFYKATSYNETNTKVSFDIIDFSSIEDSVKNIITPHRRDFYTIIFFEDQEKGSIKLNSEYHNSLQNVLLFHGPNHVFSFVRDKKVKGFIVLFEKEFLKQYHIDFDKEFPFFSIYNQNIFHLSEEELFNFQYIIKALFTEKHNSNVIKPLLTAFLQKSLLLFSQYQEQSKYISQKNLTLRKFQQLISNHYTVSKNVDYYANLLAISPTYLNEISKAITGKTSKQLIMDRILLEAKNLLLYTDHTVAEVSHFLNFSEPTHFVKFFKAQEKITPNKYRLKKR